MNALHSLTKNLVKNAVMSLAFTTVFSTAAAAEPVQLPETYVSVLTALLNVPAGLAELSVYSSHVSWAAVAPSDTANQNVYRAIVSRCGFMGCTKWKELVITEDLSAVAADGPITYSYEIVAPQPVPFYPVTQDFLDAATALLRNSNAAAETLAIGDQVTAASVTLNGDLRTYAFDVAAQGTLVGPLSGGRLEIDEDRGPVAADSDPIWNYRVMVSF